MRVVCVCVLCESECVSECVSERVSVCVRVNSAEQSTPTPDLQLQRVGIGEQVAAAQQRQRERDGRYPLAGASAAAGGDAAGGESQGQAVAAVCHRLLRLAAGLGGRVTAAAGSAGRV